MIEYSLFILIFRILAKFRNWGPQKKKNKQTNKLCCPQVGLLSFYRTKWCYPLLLIWTFSNSEVTRSFSGGPPTLRGVLLVDRTHHKVGLYASLLIWTFSRSSCEEGASERASERSRHTVETFTEKSLCKVGALSVCFFRNLSVEVLP